MEKIYDQFKINSYYTIITGIFEFDSKEIENADISQKYVTWQNRLDDKTAEEFNQHIRNNYYENFISAVYPEITHNRKNHQNKITHLTNKNLVENKLTITTVLNGKEFNGVIDFVDVYLCPGGVGIFSCKIRPLEMENISISMIPEIVKSIKSINKNVIINSEQYSLCDFFEQTILKSLMIKKSLQSYNPNLKTYAVIDLNNKSLDEKILNQVLYSIGTASEMGMSENEGLFIPSEIYYNQLLQTNRLSIFKNWTALCLFDSITRISLNLPDDHKIWEQEYYNIYVLNLYQKAFLYKVNSELSNLNKITRNTESLKTKFISFINDFRFTAISYKFLPNLIYEKFNAVLDITNEVNQMEVKIQRINELAHKRRETAISRALNIMVFLSFFTAMTDFSHYMEGTGLTEENRFPFSSFILFICITIILILVLYPPRLKK